MKKQTLLLLILIPLVSGLSIVYWPSSSVSNSAPTEITTDADYYFRNVSVKRFDSQGHLTNQLSARKLEHFNQSKVSHMSNPKIQVKNRNGEIWDISAIKGQLAHDSNQIELNGTVDIVQATPQHEAPVSNMIIRTEQLLFNLIDNSARTIQKVMLTTPNTKTTAQVMFLDLKNKQVEFNGKTQTEGSTHVVR